MNKFTNGDRAKIVCQTKYSNVNLQGSIGTVRSIYSPYTNTIPVSVDGMYNLRSGKGYYYFKASELELVDDCNKNKEETNMHKITIYLNIAKIRFVDGNNTRTYEYANFDPGLNAGDLCVVMSANHGLGVAKVVEIVDRNDVETCREVVAKVWTDEYDKRVANRAKAAEIKAKMQERAKQLQDIALYQMLAKDDPAMADLLAEFQSVSNM